MKVGETPEDAIIRLATHKCTYSEIRSILGTSDHRISETLKYFRTYQSSPPPKKRGRHSKITNEISFFILKRTLENRSVSDEELEKDILKIFGPRLAIKKSTINEVRHLLHFDYKAPKLRQLLSVPQKVTRVTFAKS
jgi:hypothetical protein